MADPPTPRPPSWFPTFPWYYVTRAIGAFVLLFGVIGDASAERGTIILTGAGLLGIDKVARSEPKDKDD
jgi:hypothetical protein